MVWKFKPSFELNCDMKNLSRRELIVEKFVIDEKERKGELVKKGNSKKISTRKNGSFKKNSRKGKIK